MAGRQESALEFKYVLYVGLLFVLVSTVIKLPSLTFTHVEPDEVVYWTLSENLLSSGTYSLQGSEILSSLSPTIYDRPLFHHPPLFPMLLIPFVVIDAPHVAVILSWLGHALSILSVALIGYVLLNRVSGEVSQRRNLLWLILLGVSMDPLLIFISRKLWIDSLLTGLTSLSIALVYLSVDGSGKKRTLLWAGLALGLAGLAKLPGVAAAAIGLLLIGAMQTTPKRKLHVALLLVAPAVILLVPWLLIFLRTYGVLLPTWLKPDPWALDHFPLVAEAVARPWYYYIAKLCLAQPFVLFLLVLFPVATRGGAKERWIPLSWFLLFLGIATYQGVTGYGFQMRYVAPLIPSAYVAMFCHPLLLGSQRRWAVPVFTGAILYAMLGGAVYLMANRHDEFLTLFEAFGPVRFGAP